MLFYTRIMSHVETRPRRAQSTTRETSTIRFNWLNSSVGVNIDFELFVFMIMTRKLTCFDWLRRLLKSRWWPLQRFGHPGDGGSGDDNHTRRGHYVRDPRTPALNPQQRNKLLQVTVSLGDISKSMYLQTVFHKVWLTIDDGIKLDAAELGEYFLPSTAMNNEKSSPTQQTFLCVWGRQKHR